MSMRIIRVQANENFVPRYQPSTKVYYCAKPLEGLEPKGGSTNASDAPPASIGQETSESKVT